MADDRHTPLEDDDWASEWDDGDDEAETSPSPTQPTDDPGPATVPDYDDDYDDDGDDDVLLPPSPSEVLSERHQQRQHKPRQARVRPAGAAAAAAKAQPPEPEDGADPEPRSDRNGRGCILAAVLGLVVSVAAVGMILLAVGGSFGLPFGGSDEAPEPQSPINAGNSSVVPTSEDDAQASAQSVSEMVDRECRPSGDSKVTVGNGRGDQSSGEGAILAFDYAYYVDRSGAKARDLMADSIRETTAETLQGAIDELPEGAEHCLTITPDKPNTYKVELAEYVPDGDGVVKSVYDQEITVEEIDNKYVIVGVVNG